MNWGTSWGANIVYFPEYVYIPITDIKMEPKVSDIKMVPKVFGSLKVVVNDEEDTN